MKIAFFTNNYLPNTGGAAIAVESYREALRKARTCRFLSLLPNIHPGFPDIKMILTKRFGDSHPLL